MLLSWSTFWLAAPACPCRCCGLCSHQGHIDCVGVFNFIVPTQWRKCNTDTALCLGCPVYTCASTSVLLQVTFQLGLGLTPLSLLISTSLPSLVPPALTDTIKMLHLLLHLQLYCPNDPSLGRDFKKKITIAKNLQINKCEKPHDPQCRR